MQIHLIVTDLFSSKASSMTNDAESKNEYIFRWQIVNFNLCVQMKGEELQSPLFTVECFGDSAWFLSLYPRGLTKDESVSCFLNRNKGKAGAKKIEVIFRIEIVGANDLPVESKSKKDSFFKSIHTRSGWDDFIQRDKLFNYRNTFLPADTLTIMCYISGCTTFQKPPVFGTSVRTEVTVDRYNFTWDVKYPTCTAVKKISLTGADQMKINLYSTDDDIEISIRKIELKSQTACNMCLLIKCRICLLHTDGFESFSKHAEHLFLLNEENHRWEFPNFIKKSQLAAGAHKYIKNNIFSLYCNFSFSNGAVSSKIEDCKFHHSVVVNGTFCADAVKALQGDLYSMYSNKKQTNVKLRVDSKIFLAHKAVLSARSPVFMEMFNEDHNGSQKVFDILDMDIKIADLFFEFIYTGSVKNLDYDSALKLFAIADKYKIPSLKEKCYSFLKFFLTEENVCDILILADSVAHEGLKTSAMNFVKAHLEKILSSDAWHFFIESNTKLATETLGNMTEELVTPNIRPARRNMRGIVKPSRSLMNWRAATSQGLPSLGFNEQDSIPFKELDLTVKKDYVASEISTASGLAFKKSTRNRTNKSILSTNLETPATTSSMFGFSTAPSTFSGAFGTTTKNETEKSLFKFSSGKGAFNPPTLAETKLKFKPVSNGVPAPEDLVLDIQRQLHDLLYEVDSPNKSCEKLKQKDHTAIVKDNSFKGNKFGAKVQQAGGKLLGIKPAAKPFVFSIDTKAPLNLNFDATAPLNLNFNATNNTASTSIPLAVGVVSSLSSAPTKALLTKSQNLEVSNNNNSCYKVDFGRFDEDTMNLLQHT